MVHRDEPITASFALAYREISHKISSRFLVIIYQSNQHLAWGEIDIPILGLRQDWFGSPINPNLGFCLIQDPDFLWFIATRQALHTSPVNSKCGDFIEGLWDFDVAELFLSNPSNGHYLEWNLSPNGAWWAASFSAPRSRITSLERWQSMVKTFAFTDHSQLWCAAIQIPVTILQDEIHFSSESCANVSAVLHEPDPKFISFNPLPGKSPDFHQPSAFSKIIFTPLAE